MSPARSVATLALLLLLLLPYLSHALSTCGGFCRTLDDCKGQLICINAKCNDDPQVGTHICTPTRNTPPQRPSPPPTTPSPCRQFGTLTCRTGAYPTYSCSPPITSSTAATLTLNNFDDHGDGVSGPSECDGQYHRNSDPIVALSTGWYSGGRRCFKQIVIWANNGRSVKATVVDECDSLHGCDAEHGGQPPCKENIVDGSQAVWDALGLNSDNGLAPVTWAMA